MTTRRDFLQMALTAPLLPASFSLRSSDGRADVLSTHLHIGSLYTVLCDDRFEESVAFAEEMSRHGTPVTHFRGDVSEFWYQDLSRRWKAGPVAIAGVTAHGPLFCLERWGWDHGLRIMHREDLSIAGQHEALIEWLIAPSRRDGRS